MDEQELHQDIDPAILELTRFKGRQLAGRYGFQRHDAEDLQQELLLAYVQRLRSFDALLCSRRTFARLVVNHRVATVIEAQKAACRDYRVCRISLDQPANHANPPELAEVKVGLADPSNGRFEESLNLRLDVQRLLNRLPAALGRLCNLLMVCDTYTEAAAKAQISRATLYRQIRNIREAFAGVGLGPLGATEERNG